MQAEAVQKGAREGAQPPKAWSPLDFEHEAFRTGRRPESFEYFARGGVRTLHHALGGSGISETVRLNDDVMVSVVNCVLPELATWRYVTHEPLVMLRASLCCDVAFHVDDSARMVFNRPEITLVCLPPGRSLAVDIVGGVRQEGLVAVFNAGKFPLQYGLEADDLPVLVRDAVAGAESCGRIASFPLDHRIAALVADTIDSRLNGELRVLQLRGRLDELVAFALHAVEQAGYEQRKNVLNRRRDVELAQSALRRLEREYRSPPSFVDLAHEVGTNKNKLKAVFKDTFGVTMGEYCLARRMREAQQLLLEASLTIAQVAERVGYEHQSSFTAAFKQYAGMSPREYRRHRAPFSVALGDAEDAIRE